jgi:hypothetical protein
MCVFCSDLLKTKLPILLVMLTPFYGAPHFVLMVAWLRPNSSQYFYKELATEFVESIIVYSSCSLAHSYDSAAHSYDSAAHSYDSAAHSRGSRLYQGVMQHAGLAEDVLDHRLNCRTGFNACCQTLPH